MILSLFLSLSCSLCLFSCLHWPLRGVESLISYHNVCAGRNSRNHPANRVKRLCGSRPLRTLSLSLTSVTPLHTLFSLTFFLSDFSNSLISCTIFVCFSLLRECLQSPSSGGQQHIHPGIHSFSLPLSIFSAFFHQTYIAILHRLSTFLLPPHPASECTGESRHMRTAKTASGSGPL